MWKDPITLVIALDKTGTHASGEIYLDDGDSYNYEKGDLVWRGFELASPAAKKTWTLTSKDLISSFSGSNKEFAAMARTYRPDNKYAESIKTVNVDDIVVLGLPARPTCIRSTGLSGGIDFDWSEGVAHNGGSKKNGQIASILRIKGAGLPITQDWQITIETDKAKACEARPAISALAQLEDPTCPLPHQARCRNEGHLPACVLVSRVNDGVCDPECCDGSDETDGKVHCPNRCAEVNKKYRKKVEEEARVARVGAKIRKDWSKAGLKEKRRIEKNVAKLKSEISALQQKEENLRLNLEKVEQSEAGDLERKKASKLYQRIEAHQEVISNLRKHREFLQTQVTDLHNLLSDLKKSFNPNYQDMAVLGAVRAFDDWRRKNGYPIDEDLPADLPDSEGVDASSQQGPKEEAVPVEVDFDNHTDEELAQLENEDIIGLLSELDSGGPGQDAANMRKWLTEVDLPVVR